MYSYYLIECISTCYVSQFTVGVKWVIDWNIYLFVCLSARGVKWQCSSFATVLLRHAPPMVKLLLVLFVVIGGCHIIGIESPVKVTSVLVEFIFRGLF